MTPQLQCFLLSCILTFLLFQFPSANSQTITFEQEPSNDYFIIKKRPATIVCAARYAVDISFTCGGTKIPPTSVELEDMTVEDPDLIRASIVVSRADVNNYRNKGVYWCECNAIGIDGQVAATSKRANITVAINKYKFMKHPTSVGATGGEDVEFKCQPPVADPKPEIFWKKDKRRINMKLSDRFVVTEEGSLIIQSVVAEDAGEYQCVSKNAAGKRDSKPADLTVAIIAEAAEAQEEVSNEDSSDESRARTARQSRRPFFSTSPKKLYYLKPNTTLTIDCGITAADIITFRCNGGRMERKRQVTSQGQDAQGNRVIQSQLKIVTDDIKEFNRKKEKDDTRSYQCQCVGWYQEGKKWKTVLSANDLGVVKLAYIEEDFVLQPTNLMVGVNTVGTLKCEPPKGQPSPWVYWFKDGVKLDPRKDDRYRVSREGHLTIASAEYTDTGRYQCVGENIVKKVESKIVELRVTAEAPPPTTPMTTTEAADTTAEVTKAEESSVGSLFLEDLPDESQIEENGIAELKCSTETATMLSIDCNGQRLTTKEYELVRKQDRQTGKTLISITLEVGSGDVAAVSDKYFCYCTAWLLKEGKWKQTNGNKGYVVEVKKTYIDDEFVYPPKDTEGYYEDAAELACEPPEGNPAPQVYWLKDGVRIDSEEDSNFVVLDAGTLILEYVRAEDAGSYVCVAENEAGMRKSDPVALTVVGIPTTQPPTTIASTTIGDIDAISSTTEFDYDDSTYGGLLEPFFTEEPQPSNYIIGNNPVTLSCIVIAAKSLIFSCNGKALKDTASTGYVTKDITGHEIRENSLQITSQEIEEYNGQQPYTCVCQGYAQRENGDWYNVESRNATIQKAFLKRRFVKEPQSTDAMLGGEVTLMCNPPAGVPMPSVYWIKDGYKMSQTENHIVTKDGSLTLKNIMESDGGVYTCAAENLVKKRTSESAKLTIKTSGSMETTMKPEPEPESTEDGMDKTTPEGSPEPSSEPSAEPSPEPSAEPTQPGVRTKGPYISKDLHSAYYLIKNKPVTIVCEAMDVETITFNCGDEELTDNTMVRESVIEDVLEDGTKKYINVVEGSITVTKEDVEAYDGDEYSCLCQAHYTVPEDAPAEEMGYVESIRGYVEIAYLRKNFVKEPENTRVNEGDFLTVPCQAPAGNPPPEVSWMKDGVALYVMNLAPEGAFIVESASMEDAGEYVCVAKNVAAKRMSPPILVEVIAGTKMTTTEGMDKDGMTDATTDDSEIEVVEITKVPLTSDSTDEPTTKDMEVDSTTTKVPLTSDSTDEPTTKDMEVDSTTTIGGTGEDTMSPSPADTDTTPDATDTPYTSTPFVDESTSMTYGADTTEIMKEDVSTTEETDSSSMTDKTQVVTDEETTPTPVVTSDDRSTMSYSSTDGNIIVSISDGDMSTDGVMTTDSSIDNNMSTNDEFTTDDEVDMSTSDGMVTDPNVVTKDIMVPQVTMVNEVEICVNMPGKCSSIVGEGGDPSKYCTEEYIDCMTSFVDGCTGLLSDVSMETASMALENTKTQCALLDQCSDLDQCKNVYEMDKGDQMDNSGLPLRYFCRDINNFMQCADQTMSDCGVTMSSPMEKKSSSLNQISSWFTGYCKKMILGQQSLESCEVMTECSLPISIPASDNSTYWCKLVDALLDCTMSSIQECGMAELETDLEELGTLRDQSSCPMEDMFMSTTDASMGGMDGADSTADSTDTVTGAASSDNDKDGATTVHVSIALLTLIQLALAYFFTQR